MEKEELIARLKSWIINIITGIIAVIIVIIISYGKLIALGVVAMLYEFLTTIIDTFWLVLTILVFAWIFTIYYNRKKSLGYTTRTICFKIRIRREDKTIQQAFQENKTALFH